MKDQGILVHLEYESDKSYDDVIVADFQFRIRAFEGSSGFMRFLDVHHGAWMKILGNPGRSRLYILGNPLIAATMVRHDIGENRNDRIFERLPAIRRIDATVPPVVLLNASRIAWLWFGSLCERYEIEP